MECPSLGLPGIGFTEITVCVQVCRMYIEDMLQKASGRTDVESRVTEVLIFETRLAHLVKTHCQSGQPYTTRSIGSGAVPYDPDMRMFVTAAVTFHRQLQQSKIRLRSPDYSDNVPRPTQKCVTPRAYFEWRHSRGQALRGLY